MKYARCDNRIKSLMSIETHSMRAAVLNEVLEQFSSQELAVFFHIIEQGVVQQEPRSRSILHSLFIDWLETAPVWQSRIAELPRSSLVAHLRHMSQYNVEDAWQSFDAKDYVFPDDRMLTLGERRARARRPEPKTIETFLYDPDRLVAQYLLQNARVTQKHVIRMACRRPTTGEALRSIFESGKFGLSRQIMLALVQNPYTPYQVAFGLAFLLSQTELNELRSIESLSPNLKRMVTHLHGTRQAA
jgi:hypothetical protein